jgi:hypothetical protein
MEKQPVDNVGRETNKNKTKSSRKGALNKKVPKRKSKSKEMTNTQHPIETFKQIKAKLIQEGMNKVMVNNKVTFNLSPTSSRMLGIPPQIKVNLKYCDHYTHTHTSGALSSWIFRGNSVYDPDVTYTGHQPLGFDELSAFYNVYRVNKSTMRVQFYSLTQDIPQVAVLTPVREVESVADYRVRSETTMNKTLYVASTGVPPVQMTHSVSTQKMFPSQMVHDQDFYSLTSTNPTKVWYWEIVTQTANRSSTSSIDIVVYIEYEVIFGQKELLGIS